MEYHVHQMELALTSPYPSIKGYTKRRNIRFKSIKTTTVRPEEAKNGNDICVANFNAINNLRSILIF